MNIGKSRTRPGRPSPGSSPCWEIRSASAPGMKKIEVSLVAARLLEELRGQAVPPLMAALDKTSDPYAQGLILETLGKIHDPRSLDTILQKSQVPSTFQEVKEEKLVNIAPSLEKPRPRPAPPEVRAYAVDALRDFKDPKVAPALIASLSDPSPEVRATAAATLARGSDPEAMEALMVAARDKHAPVRRKVMAALKRYQDRRAVVVFIAGLRDPDVEVRRIAAKALGYIRDARASQPLLRAVNDPDAGVRQNAINSMQYYNNPAAVGPLTKALATRTTACGPRPPWCWGPSAWAR
jgi:HEAT repeat protein